MSESVSDGASERASDHPKFLRSRIPPLIPPLAILLARQLNLSHTQLTMELEDLGFLLSNLHKLVALDLSSNGPGVTGDLVHLLGCRKLRRLTLSGCPAIRADVKRLKGCRNRVKN